MLQYPAHVGGSVYHDSNATVYRPWLSGVALWASRYICIVSVSRSHCPLLQASVAGVEYFSGNELFWRKEHTICWKFVSLHRKTRWLWPRSYYNTIITSESRSVTHMHIVSYLNHIMLLSALELWAIHSYPTHSKVRVNRATYLPLACSSRPSSRMFHIRVQFSDDNNSTRRGYSGTPVRSTYICRPKPLKIVF